ncbi:DUF899 domain-containing protein [Pseudoduganella violaceinigra]|uniref:DUF899 domain-containing protein n=1 Tax=Pseudoduganella violaceinigra TaxID=246602 RepID=UPI0004085E4C|nr:thioredoxin family protein [Pseudoduganella violaceinigra]
MNTVVNHEQWLARRLDLLAREKELMRQQDQLASARRALPWVRVDKQYVFDTPQGKRSLADLFEGRSQLVVQHFMFAPGKERGCPHCSYMADHTDGALPHLAQRGVSFVVVSRAPLASLENMRRELGWKFKWVSCGESDFNYDFHVSFAAEEMAGGAVYYNFKKQPFPLQDAPGISVFYKDEAGAVYHTYSTYGRGVEVMMHTYRMLDLTPLGRQEEGMPYGLAWVQYHDRYAQEAASCCGAHD